LIPAILARAVRQYAGATALVDGDRTLTYRAVAARIARLAALLREEGVSAGDRVALLAPNSGLAFEAYFAAAHAGAILVPLNFRAHAEGLQRVMEHAQARALLVAPRFEELARAAATSQTLLLADTAFDARLERTAPLPEHVGRPEDPAQIYYTSGTTGEPKGVVLTHRNVASHALLAIAALKLDDRDVWAHVAPMFHLADAWATFAITQVGGRHVMVPDFEPERVLEVLDGGVTLTNLVPTMLNDLVVARTDAPVREYRALRLMLSGGAPIAPALVERIMATFRCEYVQTYGLTETSPYLTMSLLPQRLAVRPPQEQFVWRCKTGRPLAGVDVRVVRDDLTDVRTDGREVGEVVCRGDTVTPGYWKNPAATAASFRDGWFLTGDLAVLDSEGFLQIVDRKKDVIKTGGETVFSTEVESVLCAHPHVQQAAVVGVPHERWGEAVVAVIVRRSGVVLDELTLLDHCRAHLGVHQVPKRFVFQDELPRTGSGKVAKRLLRDGLASQRGASAAGVLALLVLLAVLGGGAWWMLRDHGSAPLPEHPAASAKHDSAPAVPAEATNVPAPAAERAVEKLTPIGAAPEAERARPAPESYVKALSGVRGRLVELDGTPIAGTKVELYEVKMEPVLSNVADYFNALPEDLGRLDVSASKSGEDGVFHLDGALVDALHLLGVDFGGMRPTFRVVDVALERGVLVDLGDIVVAPALTLTGKVVDDDGAPVAGARIRALPQTPIPSQVLETGIADIRPDTAALLITKELSTIIEAPAWARQLLEKLPLPTAVTDAEGAFKLTGAPTGIITVLADKPGRFGVVKGGIATAHRKEQSVGTLTLTSGRTLSGRVVAGKQPVANARVYVGAAIELQGQHIAIGQPAGRTDNDGRFALSGMAASGGTCVALQLEEKGPWQLFGPLEKDDVVIELPPRAPLTLRVHDTAGKPVEHAEIRFSRDYPRDTPAFLFEPCTLRGNLKEEAGGVYRYDALPVGKWFALARVDGFGVGRSSFELTESGADVDVPLPPEFRARVHVVDAAGAPVEYALVSALVEGREFGFVPGFVASARTDADGRCELHRLPLGGSLVVSAKHSAFCAGGSKVTPPASPATEAAEVEITLLGGGSVAGHVRMAGAPPPHRLALILTARGDHEMLEQSFFRFALTDEDGSFRVPHLAPGDHGYNVLTRFLATEPFDFMPDKFKGPDDLAEGEFSIEEGKETTLDIDATPLDQLQPCTVRGLVHRDGRPAGGVHVMVYGKGSGQATTDDAGRFEIADVKPGESHLQVNAGGDRGFSSIHDETFTLKSAEVKDLRIELHWVDVTLVVKDADGRAVVGANVNGSRSKGADDAESTGDRFGVWEQTDSEGKATVSLAKEGTWDFNVRSDEGSTAHVKVDVPREGLAHPIEVTLDPGVRCSGRIEFEGAAPSADGDWWLSVEMANDENTSVDASSDQVDPKTRKFEVKGLRPGSYRASLYSNDGPPLRSQAFTLSSGGDTNLVLRFSKR
jgi:acyl-CoA synthetase (AMP-forming)/AMP-acid ligase II